jgi:alkanesulfonate monooxygenase SsuD/methylene tetrahydromethanopterin reductase-like flavin-dependent oxidoreductase (luciferase family)
MLTNRLQLRSGSLISPLHDAIRIAEEWSLVDQLPAGRVAISFGSGSNVNDVVFLPERTIHAGKSCPSSSTPSVP